MVAAAAALARQLSRFARCSGPRSAPHRRSRLWHTAPMVTATFRFYGGLNDFLAPWCRQRAFAAPCARAATVKHMVEALGVPHTEVELVLANGEPAGLGRLIGDGDRIAAYPKFETLDLGDLRPPAAAGAPRFVADAHLGGLARLLRMAGFDTLYDNGFDDAAIAAIAAREHRVVLTRDRELLKRREVARGCYVRALKAERQLREIFNRLELAGLARPFTLCLNCNLPLQPIDKARVLERLPPSVRERHQRFSTCPSCGGVFWEGSHWQRMRAVLAEILNPPRPENR
jgi:hypothetical protein